MMQLQENFVKLRDDNYSYNDLEKIIIDNIRNHKKIIYIGTKYGFELFTRMPKLKIFSCFSYNEYIAKLTKEHNNASVLIIDPELVGSLQIENMINLFINSEFEGGRHQQRINYITEGGNAHENYNG